MSFDVIEIWLWYINPTAYVIARVLALGNTKAEGFGTEDCASRR